MRTFAALLFLTGAFAACDDHNSSDRPAECEEIVEACHEVDPGSGAIHECHENAESEWTQAQCVSNRMRCLDLCKSPDAGARG